MDMDVYMMQTSIDWRYMKSSFSRAKADPPNPNDTNTDDNDDDDDDDEFNGHHQKKATTATYAPILRLYGREAAGRTVCLRVHGFRPYFYTPAPDAPRDRRVNLEHLRHVMNTDFREALALYVEENEHSFDNAAGRSENWEATQLRRCRAIVTSIDIVEAVSIMGYTSDDVVARSRYFRVFLDNPKFLYAIQRFCSSSSVRFPESVRYALGTGRSTPPMPLYESNVDFVLRFMIDHHMTGMQWITAHHCTPTPADECESRCNAELDCLHSDIVPDPTNNGERNSPMRLMSFDIECKSRSVQHASGKRSHVFPRADVPDDAIIQIACVVVTLPVSSSSSSSALPPQRHSVVFGLGDHGTDPIGPERAEMRSFVPFLDAATGAPDWISAEARMLEAFYQYVVSEVDPDVIMGYNIANFDWPYIMQRCKTLRLAERTLMAWGRLRTEETRVVEHRFQNKQRGLRIDFETHMSGRLQYDELQIVRNNYKLRSYTLNNVSKQFLKDQKEDVHHSEITGLWQSSVEGRRRLAEYCWKDAALPHALNDAKLLLVADIEMSRVTGVPLQYLLSKGQQIKVFSQLIREAQERNFVVPYININNTNISPDNDDNDDVTGSSGSSSDDSGDDDDDDDDDVHSRKRPRKRQYVQQTLGATNGNGFMMGTLGTTAAVAPAKSTAAASRVVGYEGAVVIEPRRGYYRENPVVTLDFASLYPSIMMAHNLCYSTLVVSPGPRSAPKPNEFKTTPHGDTFVTPALRVGVLPSILTKLLAARKRAKDDQKRAIEAGNKALAQVMDQRQLALKLSCNSVYGFTGATLGKLPCLAISASVTSYGREGIMLCKRIAETDAPPDLNPGGRNRVIYGDTDSVMVELFIDQTRFSPPSHIVEAKRIAEGIAAMINTHFLPPMNIVFEKVFTPYLLMAKKRYAGMHYEQSLANPLLATNPDAVRALRPDKLNCKGIESVRRDNCLLVAMLIDRLLVLLLKENNLDGAVAFARTTIERLRRNEIDTRFLVISRAYSKSAADYATKQPHAELVQRMAKRGPLSVIIGDRVPYVMVNNGGGRDEKACAKSEDPMFAIENQIPIDAQYYITNQLEKPLVRLLRHIIDPNHAGTNDDRTTKRALFGGSAAASTPVASAAGGYVRPNSIVGFTVRTLRCVVCHDAQPASEAARTISAECPTVYACVRCRTDPSGRAQQHMRELRNARQHTHKEALFLRTLLWTQCAVCTSHTQSNPNECQADQCEIFYRRWAAKRGEELARQRLQDVLDW